MGWGMRKNKGFYLIIFCLVCVIWAPLMTGGYLIKEANLINIVTLCINILSIPPVIYCLIKETRGYKKGEDKNDT
jgi:hypothetical protein